MRIAAIVQARMGSRRLPGKIMLRVGGQRILTHVLARAKDIPGVDVVHVTTTPDPRDDAVVNLCRGAGVGWTRGQTPLAGSPGRNDVLAGYVAAAKATHADVILRLTSDCPLLDSAVAGLVLRTLLQAHDLNNTYASNVCPPSWYDGCDVEVFSDSCLFDAHRHAGLEEREHVTTWMRRSVSRANIRLGKDEGDWSSLKLSVDEPADLERVRRTWATLRNRVRFTWRDVVLAYHRAYPPPALRRALALYGIAASSDSRVRAYVGGVLTSHQCLTGRSFNWLAVPSPTHETPEAAAYRLGAGEACEGRTTSIADQDRLAQFLSVAQMGHDSAHVSRPR